MTPREDGGLQGRGALVGGLRIGDLGGAQRATGAERHAQPAGQRRHHVQDQRRFRRPERRGARLHGHRAREAAQDDGRAGSDELHERHPGQGLGEGLGGDPGRRDRGHRAGQDERGQQGRLVGLRVRPGRAQHHRIPDQRRVRVDEAQRDRMRLEVVRPEQDPRHLDRVARALRRRDRAHERLVAVADVAVDHVQVALVDGDVHRLADRAAAVVEVRREVRQLHEVAEVLDRAVAAAAVQVADERRPVVGREHRVRSADLDVVRLVARVLRELSWRGRLDDLATHPAREPDPLALDVGAGVGEQPQARPRRHGTRRRPPGGWCRRSPR